MENSKPVWGDKIPVEVSIPPTDPETSFYFSINKKKC